MKILSSIKDFLTPFSRSKILEQYIKKMLSNGFPEEQIKDKLSSLGWGKKKIDLVFLKINQEIAQARQQREQEKWEKGKTVIIKTPKIIHGTRLVDLFRLALRMFRVKFSRTVLTILGIGFSFGVILFLVALGYGLQKHLLRQISSEETLLTLDVISPNPEILPLDNQAANRFSQMPNVEKVSPIASVEGQINVNEVASRVVFMGVSENFPKSAALNISSGRFFESSKGNEIVITSFFAQLFNISEKDLLGEESALEFFIPRTVDGEVEERVEAVSDGNKFKIVGIIEDEISNFVYLPFPLLDKLNLSSYGLVKVQVSKDRYLEETRAQILEEGFAVSSISDTIDQANKIFNALQVVLALFGIAALIVAVIGMINTMTIALLERIQEIGIMKVIGASDQDIKKLFLLESLIIGFLGGLSGLGIGLIGSQLFNLGINVLAGALGGQSINLFFYPIWFIVSIVIFASFVGVGTGIMPARRAAKMDPLQALRYK